MKPRLPGFIVAMSAFVIVCIAGLCAAVFLLAAARHPGGQDAPIWLGVGLASATALVLAAPSAVFHSRISRPALVLRFVVALVLVSPGMVLLLMFGSYPP